MCKAVSKIESFPSLQKIFAQQQSGVMTPLYSDQVDVPFDIQYVYAGSLFPKTIKGPYRHLIRNGNLFFLCGEAIVVHRQTGTDKFCEDYMTPMTKIILPSNEEYCLIGLGNKEIFFINLCSYAWRPGDIETQVPDFSNYNFKQWGIL